MTTNAVRARAHNRSDAMRNDRAGRDAAEIAIAFEVLDGLVGRDKEIVRRGLVRALAVMIVDDQMLTKKVLFADLYGMHLRAFINDQSTILRG